MYMTKNCENNWQVILKKTVLSCFAYFKEFFFSKKNKRKKKRKSGFKLFNDKICVGENNFLFVLVHKSISIN